MGYHSYMYHADSKLFITTFERQTFSHDVIIKAVIEWYKLCMVRNVWFYLYSSKRRYLDWLFIILSSLFYRFLLYKTCLQKNYFAYSTRLNKLFIKIKPLCSKVYNWLVLLFCLVFFYDNTKTMKPWSKSVVKIRGKQCLMGLLHDQIFCCRTIVGPCITKIALNINKYNG